MKWRFHARAKTVVCSEGEFMFDTTKETRHLVRIKSRDSVSDNGTLILICMHDSQGCVDVGIFLWVSGVSEIDS